MENKGEWEVWEVGEGRDWRRMWMKIREKGRGRRERKQELRGSIKTGAQVEE